MVSQGADCAPSMIMDCGWSRLHRAPRCQVCVSSSPGCVLRPQYKFIVDGEWKYAADQTAMYDEQGNVNNVLEVQEYVPENLESLSSFDPPASPVSRHVSQGAGA